MIAKPPYAPRLFRGVECSRSAAANTGVASDATVRTVTRFAMRIVLSERPRPHSRPQPPDRIRGTQETRKQPPENPVEGWRK